MRFGIMQPYFFPNLAHFALIAATDKWIVFDVTKYTRKSWMNRNRILHPKEGWNYTTVAMQKTNLETKTLEARLADPRSTHRSLCGKLSHYKNSAPFYKEVCCLVDRVFDCLDDDSLVTLNVIALREVCAALKIPFDYSICSQMNLDFPKHMRAGDWAPYICSHVGAESYVNPAGGRDLFDPADFEARGIDLYFAHFENFVYSTGPYTYVAGLSILDVLMWNSASSVRAALESYLHLESATSKGPQGSVRRGLSD